MSVTKLSLLLSIILLFSCQSNIGPKHLDPGKVFSVKDTLKGIFLEATLSQDSACYNSLIYTPLGLICDSGINEEVFFLLDTTRGDKLSSWGCIGRGPEEMLSTISSDFNISTNNVYVWDLQLNVIHSFSFEDHYNFKKRDRVIKVKTDLYRIKSINDSLFVVLTFYPKQSLGLVDATGNFIDKIPYRVINDKSINYDLKYFSSDIAISPDKKYVAVKDLWFPSLKLYLINNNKLTLVWEKMVFKPSFNIVNNWPRINDDQQTGFGDVQLDQKYIYALSSGLTIKDIKENKDMDCSQSYLLQFDYQGNFIKSYVLDNQLYLFDITPDGRLLYGLGDDVMDNRIIKKYTLI